MVIPDDATVVTRLKQGLRVWIVDRRLRGKISELSEQELAWGVGEDAPRVFCPNAAFFDEISVACRRDGHVSQALESEGRRP
jgi:hypothetical protein